MFYQERVIEGVLHYRLTPDGEWVTMTSTQLTDKIEELKKQLKETKERLSGEYIDDWKM